jgi:hypothetical protein
VREFDVTQARLSEATDAAPSAEEFLEGDEDDARLGQVFAARHARLVRSRLRQIFVGSGALVAHVQKVSEVSGGGASALMPVGCLPPSPLSRRAKLLTSSMRSLARKGFEM